MLNRYGELGYAVLPDFLDRRQLDRLRQRLRFVLDESYKRADPPILFGPGSSHDEDLLFLDSGDQARVFHHRPPGPSRDDYSRNVNRVGHGLHVVDPVVRELLRTRSIADILALIGVQKPLAIESLFLRKADYAGALHVHIDHWYLFTSPASVVLLWFSLDAADEANGCLYVSPDGPIRAPSGRMRRISDRATLNNADVMPPFEDLVALPVEAGTLVVIDGRLPHASGPRRSGTPPRDALGVHIIDGTATLPDDLYLGATCRPIPVAASLLG